MDSPADRLSADEFRRQLRARLEALRATDEAQALEAAWDYVRRQGSGALPPERVRNGGGETRPSTASSPSVPGVNTSGSS